MSYSRKEISRRQYLKKKEAGVCLQCGGELDRKGSYCNWCNDKFNAYCKIRRKELREKGICPYCRKTKLNEGEKKCVTCREKARKYAMKYRENKKQ